MFRLLQRLTRRAIASRLVAGGILAGVLGCMNDAPVAATHATAGLVFSANVLGTAAGRTIEIGVKYRRASGEAVGVPGQPARVSLEPGTTIQQAVTVDLTGCLKDDDRLPKSTPGCQLFVELRLLDEGGNTVDVQTKEAPGAPTAPGQVVELGNVTVGIQVGSVAVTPASVRLNVTQTQQLAATVKDTRGATLGSSTITWESSDPSVVQLSTTTGAAVTVTAGKLGAATIVASSGGKTSPPIPVLVVSPDPLVVAPGSASLEVGATLQLQVENPPGSIAWQSSDPTIASVDQSGLVRGVQAREDNPVTITATSGTGPTQRAGTARISVTTAPPLVITQQPGPGCVIVGQTVTLGVASPPAAVTWASDNPAIATVNPASGVVTGQSAGQASLRATSANRSGTTSVCVVGPLGNVPASLPVTAGQTAQLSPSGATAASLSYTSDNTNVATVSGSGLITGVGLGQAKITTTLTAASGSQSAATTVTVNAASITIAPSPVSVTVGGKQSLLATARDADGKALSGGAFTWTADDASVVRLSATSGNPVEVEGLKLGATSVRASAANATGTVQVTVTRGAPASIAVTLGNPSLTVGQTTTATAEVKDAAGNVLTDQTVSWSAGNTGVATVASTGARTATVTAVGVGPTDITASIGSVSGKAPIQVAEVPVATLTVSPTSASIAFGGSGQVLTAVPKDAQGNTLVGRTVTWTVTAGDTSVVRLSAESSISTASGATITVTAVKVGGPVTITATSGKTANAQITVTPGAPASITVTLASPSLKPGQTTTATAVVKDAAGNTVPGLTVTWVATGSSIATASSTGPLTATVTALNPGTSDIRASVSGVTGQATLQVTQNDPASVTVTPTPVTVQAGGAAQTLSAAVKDARGVPLSGQAVSWTVTAGDATLIQMTPPSGLTNVSGVVTTSVSGLKAGGPVTVTATSGGKTGSAQITVTPGEPATITLTPSTLSLTVGQTATATAVVKDAQGTTLTSLANGLVLSWQPGSSAAATVSPVSGQPFQAQIRGNYAATNNVLATLALPGKTITSNAIVVTVIDVTPADIVADSPNNPTCAVNTFDCQFAVKVTNSIGQPVSGAAVDWTTTNVGCSESFRKTTDAQGRSTTGNTCTTNIPGTYTQTATLVATAKKITFSFQLLGFTLRVQPLGGSTGNGQVTSTGGIGGLDCTITAGSPGGASCVANFGPGTVVKLTATPTGGSVFAGWGGATCAEGGTTQATCTVTMSQSRNLTVNFAPEWGQISVVSQTSVAPGVSRRVYSLISTGGTLNGLVFVGVTYPPEQQYKDFISNVAINGGPSTPTTVILDDTNGGRPVGSSSTFYLTFRTSTPGVTPNPMTYQRTSVIPTNTSRAGAGDTGTIMLAIPADAGAGLTPRVSPRPTSTIAPLGGNPNAVSPKATIVGPTPRAFVNPELMPRNATTIPR